MKGGLKDMAAAAALLWGLLGLVPAGFALGLRTKFAEVSVERLKIGKTYSLAEAVNFPLRVTNTGTEPVDLAIEVVPPMAAGEFKEGFEPIPDAGWISLQRSSFTVAPNMEAVTDVIVSIPNDEKLLGRRFVVYLWSTTQNLGATGVGVKSRLLLSISSQKPTEDELKEKFVRKKLANLNFSLAPMEVVMEGVPLGKTVAVKSENADVSVVNPNKDAFTFRLTSVPIWETSVTPPKGWHGALDPKWLEVPDALVKVKPYSVKPVKLKLKIPVREDLKGKKMVFLLRAEILEQEITAYAYVQIFVETAK